MGVIRKYIFRSAKDLSVVSYNGNSFLYSAYGQGRGITFKPDGTEMYLILHNSDVIQRFTLSTAWDISTATKISNSINVGGISQAPHGITISQDGLKFYVGDWGDKIRTYTASTAWDSATLTLDVEISNMGDDISFFDNGNKCYVKETNNANLKSYSLGTAWDLTTAVYNDTFTVTTGYGFTIAKDGKFIYYYDGGNITLYRFSESFNFGSLYKTTTIDISSTVIGSSYDIAISTDGTKLFPIAYTTGDDSRVKELDLSIPFLIENQTL